MPTKQLTNSGSKTIPNDQESPSLDMIMSHLLFSKLISISFHPQLSKWLLLKQFSTKTLYEILQEKQ
jgi:hypothetical protein